MEIMPRMRGGYIFIDGASVGEIDWPVLRDRDKLAQSGYFFAILSLNGDGAMLGTPDILSRGFIDLDEGAEVIEGGKETIERVVTMHKNNGGGKLSKKLEDSLSRYLYAETGRRPLVQVIIK
jgi:ribonuclease J